MEAGVADRSTVQPMHDTAFANATRRRRCTGLFSRYASSPVKDSTYTMVRPSRELAISRTVGTPKAMGERVDRSESSEPARPSSHTEK